MAELSLNALLKSAEAARRAGDLRGARAQYQAILQRFPANQKAKKALAGLAEQPSSAPAALPETLNRQIVQALSSGQTKQALALASQATQRYAQAPQSWLLLGVVYQALGDLQRAERAFDAAVRLNPASPAALYNRGLMQQQLKQYEPAIASYQQCLKHDPAMVDALNNWGVVLRDTQRLEAAITRWEQALAIQPDHVETLINLGNARFDLRDMETAIGYYRRAIAAQPQNTLALANLCEALEKCNQLDDLDAILADLDEDLIAAAPALRLQRASSLARRKDFAGSRAHLDAIDPAAQSQEFRSKYFELLGKTLEKLGDYTLAFKAYEGLNAVVSEAYRSFAPKAQAYLARSQQRASEDWSQFDRPDLEQDGQQPVFLVGFPRSGTTLMDTFLRGHRDVQVFEETDALHQMVSTLPPDISLKGLCDLSPNARQALRQTYECALERHSSLEDRRLWIDKFPLNLAHAPEILTAYPHAKFILALRHPLDCVLSCFKQNFVINDAMYLMTDVQQIAQLYDATFQIFFQAMERSGAAYHSIRYEDLIADKKTSLETLLAFLGLPWDDATLDHEATAKGRGKINTPSYSQVTQPLYKDSTYLWRHYAAHLAEAQDKLAPWIKRLGYEA